MSAAQRSRTTHLAPVAADDEPLEPELLRLIAALARAHAREDYAAAQAAAERPNRKGN